LGKRTNYINPDTKEVIWCIRGNQPENWVEIKHFKKVDELKNTISKEELFIYYIIENNNFITTAKYFNINPANVLHDLLKYYGIHKDSVSSSKNNKYKRSKEESILVGQKSSLTQKEKWKNKSIEEKEEYKEKQKIAHSTDTFRKKISDINREYRKELKDTDPELDFELNRRRSISCKKTWSNKDLIDKRNETAKKNRLERKNQICRTKAEQSVYNVLINLFPDLIYDKIIDERYPYHIDFYIPSEDLFIELNAHPSHGKHPFTGDLNECYNITGNWLDTYIRRDVEKRNCAISNNLNYLVIYPQSSLRENISFNPEKYKDLIKIIYNSQNKSH